MKISIELEERHLTLLNTLRENWSKLGLGLDASEAMIDLMTRAAMATKEFNKEQMIKQATQIVAADKKAKKEEKKCSCDGKCKD